MSLEVRRAAVIGNPISHSLSPKLHNAAYQALGLKWQYSAIAVEAGDLADFLEHQGADFAGLSVTMPLKYEAFSAAIELDEASRLTGACNTLLPSKSGWFGFNTDVEGIREVAARFSPKRVLILGSGATTRSAVLAVSHLVDCEIIVAARRPKIAQQVFFDLEVTGGVVELSGVLPSADLIINALPGKVILDVELPPTSGVWFDLAYHPWPTDGAAKARAAGFEVVSGLELLVAQAVSQCLLMTRTAQSNEKVIRSAMEIAIRPETSALNN